MPLPIVRTGISKWGRFVGEAGAQFGQNGRKLHENYKINIFEAKQ